MTSFFKIRFGLMLVLSVLELSCASGPVKKPEVIAKGVGTSLLEAKNDAIRQGIQYLVGSYVTSDLESNNGLITRDHVMDYAGGIVDRFAILNQKRRTDGLYEMTARMQVAGDAGRQRDRSAIAKPGTIDGQSLQAEAMSRFKLQSDTERLWKNTFTGFPGRAVQYEIVSPNIVTNPGDNGQVTLTFYTVSFWRQDFLDELRTVLNTTAHAAKAQNAVPYGIQWIGESPNDQQTGICLMKGFRSASPWQEVACYIVDLPSQHFEKWLCRRAGITLHFKIPEFNVGPLRFENKEHKDLMPYLEVDRYGAAVFVFYSVDTEMIKDRTDYQQHISVPWAVNMPVDALPSIKNISARAECLQT
jgi:hypothetical protein